MTANPETRRSLSQHIATIPRWQKTLLILSILLVVCGLAGQAGGLIKSQHQSVAQPNSRGFVEGQPSNEPAPAPEKPWYQKLSPHAMGVGLSILVGFVIGWAIRAFMKITATIAALVCAIFLGLSYFNVTNVDLSKAQQRYESSKAWFYDQAGRLNDVVKSHLPRSGGTVLGMFIGFRRKS